MLKENFINYQNYRWFWINLLFVLAMCALYLVDDPIGGRRGDTPVGYFFGVLSTLGILILMWFGRRKRAYYSKQGFLVGWLSAHVWIGLALLLLVPLHSGFQFGSNIHTLAYVLMTVTIASGIWGAFSYIQYPSQILSHRGADSSKEILGNVMEIVRDIEEIEKGKSDEFMLLLNHIDVPFSPKLSFILFFRKSSSTVDNQRIADLIMGLPNLEREQAVNIVGLVREKRELLEKLRQEISVKFYLKIWLFFHVPLAIALCVSLVIHIFSVFFYW